MGFMPQTGAMPAPLPMGWLVHGRDPAPNVVRVRSSAATPVLGRPPPTA